MKISQLVLGPIETNVYFFLDEETKEGFMVDPAIPSPAILNAIEELGMELKYILLTHRHFDHITGVPFVKEHFPEARVVIGQGDSAVLSNPEEFPPPFSMEMPELKPCPADLTVKEGDTLTVGGMTVRVMETPGHTPGGVIYLLDDEQIMISGDTVFYHSFGRTDFPGGSMEQLKDSLARIGALPQDYNILCGHGPMTTLSEERKADPYMSAFV